MLVSTVLGAGVLAIVLAYLWAASHVIMLALAVIGIGAVMLGRGMALHAVLLITLTALTLVALVLWRSRRQRPAAR